MSDQQIERMHWLRHVLSDSDAGRLLTRLQLVQMAEELELLEKLFQESEDPQ